MLRAAGVQGDRLLSDVLGSRENERFGPQKDSGPDCNPCCMFVSVLTEREEDAAAEDRNGVSGKDGADLTAVLFSFASPHAWLWG